jgi:hypothetical protein
MPRPAATLVFARGVRTACAGIALVAAALCLLELAHIAVFSSPRLQEHVSRLAAAACPLLGCTEADVRFAVSLTLLHVFALRANEMALLGAANVYHMIGIGLDAADARGATALHYAARAGNSWAVYILLSRGANVNAQDFLNRTAADLLLKEPRSAHRQESTFMAVRYLELAAAQPFPAPRNALEWLLDQVSPPRAATPRLQHVDRMPLSSLSAADFQRQYAHAKRPVVLTDALGAFNISSYTPRLVADACGSRRFDLSRFDAAATSWAKLNEMASHPSTVGDFISRHFQQDSADTPTHALHSQLRIFDQGFVKHCGSLGQHFTVPPHFGIDLRRVWDFEDEGFHQSHPSLFVDPRGVKSGLHIDSGATSFWMVVLSGRKQFRFAQPTSVHLLKSDSFHDQRYHNFLADLFEPDTARFPSIAELPILVADLGPGDLVYVPAGTPHQVVTPEDTVAFSANLIEPAVAADAFKFCCLDMSVQHNSQYIDCASSLAFVADLSPAKFGELSSVYRHRLQRQSKRLLGLNFTGADISIPMRMYADQHSIAASVFGMRAIPAQSRSNQHSVISAELRAQCARAGFP